ncbi:PQQ-binding-like beta-propeller repeat protein [Haloparvum sp. PAK95]|uniref:PQQ-binding-like beta-propeller repeat protein n=1 Tax=Haloparvum sp. PAK95 TaxID=3418962 RepID=UPI003D2EC835
MKLSRRSLLAGVGGTATAISAPTAAESSGDWSTLQGNSGRRGRTNASLPTSTPSTRWTATIAEKIYAGAAPAGNRAYVASYDGELAALGGLGGYAYLKRSEES